MKEQWLIVLQIYYYNFKLHTLIKIILKCLNFGNSLRVSVNIVMLTNTCNIFRNFEGFKVILLNISILEL